MTQRRVLLRGRCAKQSRQMSKLWFLDALYLQEGWGKGDVFISSPDVDQSRTRGCMERNLGQATVFYCSRNSFPEKGDATLSRHFKRKPCRQISRRFPPLHRLGLAERSGDVGEHCPSAQRELRSRPIFPVNRGQPKAGAVGRPSLGYFS